MANLIITVIAIALVAISALMGVYYGGSAFLNDSQAANASTVMNEATEINGAWQAYLVDHAVQIPKDTTNTPDVGLLVTQNYLSRWPQFPGSVGANQGSFVVLSSNSHYYAAAIVGTPSGAPSVTDVAAQACVRVIKTALGAMPTAIVQTDFATLTGGGANVGTATFGCGAVNVNGGFAVLNNSAAANPQVPAATTYVMYYYLS